MKRNWLIPVLALPILLIVWGGYQATHPENDTAQGLPAVISQQNLSERAARIQGIKLSFQKEALTPTLTWEDGTQEPDIGDPAAKKGGHIRRANVGPYPAHFLAFGGGTPQFFHYNLFTMIDIPLVKRHPVTGNTIPGTAQRWAVQGKTVYFELNPAAKYSNNRPVQAADYILGIVLRAECRDGQFEQCRQTIESVTVLQEHLLAVTLREPSPQAEQLAASLLHAAEPSFYAEFGSDYIKRYAQRIPPTTGAYTVSKTVRGRSIQLIRQKNWWAKDLPFYRNTCNVDSIEHIFPTDEAQCWELFLRGRLDMLQTRNIVAWKQYLANAPLSIQRHIFHADYPLPPYGIALNAKTIPHQLRRGLMHAMDMEQAMQVIFHGEAERLSSFASGYGKMTPTTTPTYDYSPETARRLFAEAGYTSPDQDGILRRDDGTALRFVLSFSPSDKISTLVGLLKQSAANCGVDIILNPVPWQNITRMQQEDAHQLLFWAAMPGEPLPDYRRFFLPEHANTDAPFGVSDHALTEAIQSYEQSSSIEEQRLSMARVDHRIAELCVWLPGWKENVVRLACHSHIRFPNCPQCQFSTPLPYEVQDAHLYWIETQKP